MTAISDKGEDLLRGGFRLGRELGDEEPLEGGGRYHRFEHATIYWSRDTGAHAVTRAFDERYRELGGPTGSLGFPLTDSSICDARSTHTRFEHGSLYRDRNHPASGIYLVGLEEPIEIGNRLIQGQWDIAPFSSGVVGVHAAVLRHNKVLFFTYQPKTPGDCTPWPTPFGESAVIDLNNNGYRTTPTANDSVLDPSGAALPGVLENLFCAGQAFLGDGRLMVGGGEREDNLVRHEQAVRAIHIFTPGGAGGGTWTRVASCRRGRWYTTCATLPDGKVLIIGGSVRQTNEPIVANTAFEIFDPATNTVSLESYIPDDQFAWWSSYPFVFAVPGNQAWVHFGMRSRFLNLATRQFTNVVLESAERLGKNGRTYGIEGTAVLLPLLPTSTPPYRTRIMMIGGGGPWPNIPPGTPQAKADQILRDNPATNSCEVLDLGASPLAWQLVAPMRSPRVMPDAVLLPDGTVFVCSGSSKGTAGNAVSPVTAAEIYDPVTNRWSRAAHASVPRLYHSTAVLLADGRVLTAGTDCTWNPVPYHRNELRIEIYSPPYCFGPRPDIGHPPGTVFHGAELDVPTAHANAVESAAIIRCGSVTHSFNSDQRYVGLSVISRTNTSVRLAFPSDNTVAPPGIYLLFLLNASNVPSVGRYVRLRPLSIVQTFPPGGVARFERAGPKGFAHGVPDADPNMTTRELDRRIERLEADVKLLLGFVEQHERPGFLAHGAGDAGHAHVPSEPANEPGDPHNHGHEHDHRHEHPPEESGSQPGPAVEPADLDEEG